MTHREKRKGTALKTLQTSFIHVRVSEELGRDVRLLALAEGVSRSELMRQLIRQRVAEVTGQAVGA